MPNHPIPTRDDVLGYLRGRSNWGRWGADDQRGAINLITPEKRVRAAGLVRSGRSVSLSRDVPVTPGRGNPMPAQHFVRTYDNAVVDYYGISYHGYVTTHIDALCHVWSDDGMWNGRDPAKEISGAGARFGSIDHWRDGITTRGVLLDVPRYRGVPSVMIEEPVHGWELEAIAAAQGVVRPGDRAGIFTVFDRTDREILMGGDDTHLDFRASLLTRSEAGDTSVVLSTVVHFNRRLGRAYFFFVRPFHRLIIPAMLRRLSRTLERDAIA